LAIGLVAGPGALRTLDIAHDTWCDALNGRGFCNCDPGITVRAGIHAQPLPRRGDV
jgi:hypothetical protein